MDFESTVSTNSTTSALGNLFRGLISCKVNLLLLIFRTSCQDAELTPDEYRHVRARRMKDGDEVFVGDGAGHRISGILEGRAVRVAGEVTMRIEPSLRIFSAIPEASRFDWMLQKCTELGATDFVPLLCERSERRSVRVDRSEKIIEEAAVQAGRFVLPRLHAPMTIEDALGITRQPAYLLEPRCERWLLGSGGADFWIGPEGGFSPAEKAALSTLTAVSISNHILRVETAAAAALARYGGPP